MKEIQKEDSIPILDLNLDHLLHQERNFLKELILEHSKETMSKLSKKIFENYEEEIKNFVQVCPKEMVDKLKHPITLKSKIQKVS